MGDGEHEKTYSVGNVKAQEIIATQDGDDTGLICLRSRSDWTEALEAGITTHDDKGVRIDGLIVPGWFAWRLPMVTKFRAHCFESSFLYRSFPQRPPTSAVLRFATMDTPAAILLDMYANPFYSVELSWCTLRAFLRITPCLCSIHPSLCISSW